MAARRIAQPAGNGPETAFRPGFISRIHFRECLQVADSMAYGRNVAE
jgi:hypothetical protein